MRMGSWGLVLAVAAAGLAACGQPSGTSERGGHGAAAAGEFERGPHRGRMLRSGDFAVELTIFESGVPPEYRVYAFNGGKAVKPADVKLSVVLKRLGGKTDTFAFAPVGDYLRGNGVVTEPHSFDVEVTAVHSGKTHKWAFASYEGRTTIGDKAASEAGVTTEPAGPATINLTVSLLGTVDLAPGAKAELRARFPGRVVSVAKSVGDKVNVGETLARVESNESLQTYAITSPIAGVVQARDVNPGDVTDERVLFVVGDASKLAAQFHVFDRDAGQLKAGQAVKIMSLDGKIAADTTIASISPVKDPATQTVIARALLGNEASKFLPGTSVKADVVVEAVEVALAVKTEGIQPFRDFEVVYAKVGETYEVRMLEIGRRSPEWTEVLGGIDPGEVYVSANSYLIKADIEKSGASHDH
jgi:membrane fusion protein, heavy metal efflux system